MAANDSDAFNTFDDPTHPDVSLGSFKSSFSSNHGGSSRNSSGLTTGSNSLATPRISSYNRTARNGMRDASALSRTPKAGPSHINPDEDDGGATTATEAKTPARERKSLVMDDTPVVEKRSRARPSATGSKASGTLTLREQEKLVESKEKEIFSLKLQIHFLNERLSSQTPDNIEITIRQNIDLKLELQSVRTELKKFRKACNDLEREVKNLQAHNGKTSAELEDQIEDRDREIEDLRRRLQVQAGGDDDNENERAALLDRQASLEDELDNTRGILEETNQEMDQLREALERERARSSSSASNSRSVTSHTRLEQRIQALEEQNAQYAAELDDARDAIAERDQAIENIEDVNAALKLDLEQLEHENRRALAERSESRAEVYEEREEREALEEGNNHLRDRLAAATIELEQKENDLEVRNEELTGYLNELDQRTQEVEDWKTEVREERARVEELQDGIVERETQIKDLQIRINELESTQSDLHDKFEVALTHLEKESGDKDAELARLEAEREEREGEVEGANREMERLSTRVWELEDELERTNERLEREVGEVLDKVQADEQMVEALKEKLAQAKFDLSQTLEQLEIAQNAAQAHHSREEELAKHAEDMSQAREADRAARIKSEREVREFGEKLVDAEDEIKSLRRELGEVERSLNSELDEKNATLQEVRSSLQSTRTLLEQREADLNAVQSALRALENEKRKLGESHTTDRFSLELEVDRLKRDLSRCEDELERAREDVKERERARRDRDGAFDKLYAENRDLASQLAAQTQARLNVSDKLDTAQASLKQSEIDLSVAKARVAELEQKFNKDQRSLLATEHQYRDQLTERNTLLLTIYQYMDKILGVDKTPKKGGAAETKPFTNFGIFHDNLISRLKALSQIQLDFDKRVKEAEAGFTNKLAEVKKQLDFRWKQIDRFETSVKALAEVKHTWRRKYNVKEGECEAVKASNIELAAQLSALKRSPVPESSADIRALTARATQAERRATVAQNQLALLEERLMGQSDRTNAAELKWEARIKEYERLLKEANEKFKRERQGAKERVGDLETNIKVLQKQVEQTNKRTQQLNDVMEAAKGPPSPTTR